MKAKKELPEEQIIRHIHSQETPSYQDSISIGTPGRGGELKVYFNSSDMEGAVKRIDNAIDLLKNTRKKIENISEE